ncbi:MAG: glycosyltransferase [Bacteroidetes bacterium]|nr:glycosyltransferase [Bacteroidota bacterium]
MRILFLTTQLPYPPKSGGLIKSWRLLEHWSRVFEVGLMHPLKQGDKDYLSDFLSSGISLKEHFYIPLEVDRSGWNLMMSYLGHRTLNVFRNYSRDFRDKVSEVIQSYDVLFLDHYEMGQYIPDDCSIPVIFHEHNAEYMMWSRLAEIEQNPIKRSVIQLEAFRIKKAESAYAERATQIWAAPNDQIELKKLGIEVEKMVTTYHLGEDDMLDAPELKFQETERRILFIGTLTWEANIDGLLWFIENVWPIIEKDRTIHFDIIGKNPDERLLNFAKGKERIHFHGFVEELESFYKRSRVFIVPLRFGSGIKVKLLNAMYRGLPTVTTEIGTEGLDIREGDEIFQTHKAETYAEKVLLLMNDEPVWSSMSKNSRRKARRYSWKELLDEHDKSLEQLMTNEWEKPN